MSTTAFPSYRQIFKNRTLILSEELADVASRKIQDQWMNSMSLLENLPSYLAISYLSAHFSIQFLSSLVEYSFNNRTKKSACKNTEYVKYKELVSSKDDHAPENHHLKYIKGLFKSCHLFNYSPSDELNYQISSSDLQKNRYRPRAKLSVYLMKQKSKIIEKTSFFLHLFETYVYRVRPHMKYSKQFINTYTIAFMVVYFFTLYGFKLSDYLSESFSYFFKFIFKLAFHESINSFGVIDGNNFNYEFKITILLSSLGIIIQLLLSIRKFHNDLVKLHMGENFLSLLLFKHKKQTYSMKARKRDKAISSIISNSLHFSGYLVAHLVYGYILLFLTIFVFVILFKFLYHFPRISSGALQLALPFFIMICLKYLMVEWFIPRYFFMSRHTSVKSKLNNDLFSTIKTYKLSSYYIVSYFNFFLDCFLGLTSCMSRMWLNNLVSVLTLARIDISMFNHENNFLIKRLDKAYLAYISYVRMEHFYNNPIMNGFCDLMVDMMITTKKDRERLELINQIDQMIYYKIFNKQKAYQFSYTNVQSMTSTSILSNRSIPSFEEEKADTFNVARLGSNKNFKYDSLLRLRNIMYLCLLLKRNPILAKVRFKNLSNVNKPSGRTENLHEAIKRIYKNYLGKE
jgi:hypothetical protein